MNMCTRALAGLWLTRVLSTVLALLCVASTRSALAADRTEVFVIGSLYSRHQSVPAYDLDALRRIVLAVKPHVLVIDCTPKEIREQKVHASKIEYPGVVFPLVREKGYLVYAAEPDEPLFTQIVEPLAQARSDFAQANPEQARILKDFEGAAFAALKLHWQAPADVHDELTALVLAARKALDSRLYGRIQSEADLKWNEHWAAMVRKAAAENPGKRILAIAGIDNRRPIESSLKRHPDLHVVDVAAWLHDRE